jgi:REP element-mobilizing transposase RayT
VKNASKKPQRKSVRLKEYDYSFPGWYFVTICAYERNYLFGNIKNGKMILNDSGNLVGEEWIRTKKIRKNVDLDYYVIMPNHLHGIIIIIGRGELNSPANDNTGRMQYAPTNIKFKSPSQTINNVGATRGVVQDKQDRAIQRIAPTKQTLIPNSLGSIIGQFKSRVTKRLRESSGNPELKIWQRNYYEHIIRNDLDLHNIRNYIENNPLKWELDEYYNL